MRDNIDTIILDLGGVLIDVDYERTAQEFAAMGFAEFDQLYSKAKQDHVFNRFETGELDPKGFRNEIRKLLQADISDKDIDRCWNAMLGSVPPERLELVEELKKKCQVLLLSNTNAIHVPAFTSIVARENGIQDFKGLFDGAYYSCEIGLRKPNAEVYHYVLEKHDADPSNTLFIDDSLQHVVGAKHAGLEAELLDLPHGDLTDLLKRTRLIA